MADLEATRQIADAKVISTTLDFCKNPTVPVGYMIVGIFTAVEGTANSVRMTQCVAFTADSRVTTVTGNEAGVGGGVVSNTNLGYCKPTSWSSTVRCEGKWLCRHGIEMEMNCLGPEGLGNVLGRVVYLECSSYSFVNPDGEIVVDEDEELDDEDEELDDEDEELDDDDEDEELDDDDEDEELDDDDEDFKDDGDESEAQDEVTKSTADDSKESQGFARDFGDEVGGRVKDELGGIKDQVEGAWDLVTKPEARQEALDSLKQSAEAIKQDPIGSGKQIGKEVFEDIAEPFKDAYGKAMSGRPGAATGAVLAGVVNLFNPMKKVKIIQKVGKIKLPKTKPSSRKRRKKNKKDRVRKGRGKDGAKVTKVRYRRNMSERRKALLRDANDPNSKLTQKERDFIKKHDGKKVPPGMQVHHKRPLYTQKTMEGKAKLDVAKNLETIRRSEHVKLHSVCGAAYHRWGPPGR